MVKHDREGHETPQPIQRFDACFAQMGLLFGVCIWQTIIKEWVVWFWYSVSEKMMKDSVNRIEGLLHDSYHIGPKSSVFPGKDLACLVL